MILFFSTLHAVEASETHNLRLTSSVSNRRHARNARAASEARTSVGGSGSAMSETLVAKGRGLGIKYHPAPPHSGYAGMLLDQRQLFDTKNQQGELPELPCRISKCMTPAAKRPVDVFLHRVDLARAAFKLAVEVIYTLRRTEYKSMNNREHYTHVLALERSETV